MSPRALQALIELALGPTGHQRVRTSQTLLSLMVFTLFALVQHGEVMLGMIEVARANALTVFNLTGATAFYLVIRTGLSTRFAKDPALTLPQCMFAMTSITWSYSIAGPARGGVMMIMLLVIFFGMFALSPRQARGLGAFGLGLLATVMIWRTLTEPERYDPRVELFHFVYAAIVIGAVSVLSIRLGKLRSRLSRQKKELQEALERIQMLATRDALTGLLNRRAMLDTLTHEAHRVPRGNGPMSLALIDLDHFKRINDTHGHAAGDRVLCAFAFAAREALRGTDVLSRWGGEEFMLLLPGTGPVPALSCIERVRARLADTKFDDIAPHLGVTFSAGLTLCQGETDLEQAIERADMAMYQAKAQGRNRTVSTDALITPDSARDAGTGMPSPAAPSRQDHLASS